MANLVDGMDTTSSQSSVHGPTCTISGTSFAASVLTFEGIPIASLLKVKSSPPVYVHHVVLCPLKPISIGITSTTPFSPAPLWVRVSKLPSGNICYLSGTIVPSLKMGTFLSEIVYRRKYGPVANLHWTLLATKVLQTPVDWRLIRETSYSTQMPICMPCLHYSPMMNINPNPCRDLSLEREATIWYERKLVDIIAGICHDLEPVVID